MPLTLRIPVPRFLAERVGLVPRRDDQTARPAGLDEVERRMVSLEQRLARLDAQSPERPGLLNNLGNRYRDHYLWTLEPSDLDRAVATFELALAGASQPADTRALILNNQATALFDRYLRSGDLADLERSIDQGEQALVLAPSSLFLSNLSNRLRERFSRTSNRADVQRAVDLAQQAVDGGSPDPLEAAGAQINLGLALITRGGPSDRPTLEQAIQQLAAAVPSVPPARPEYAMALSAQGLAELALCKLDAGEGTVRIDHAIGVLMTAFNASHPGAPGTAAILHGVGKACWQRYDRTRLAADLENATLALSEAVRLTPDGLAELPMYLNDLAIVASERFFTADQERLSLLDPAVEALERAWSAVETSFAADSVAYQVGQQWHAMTLGLAERLVTFYDLAAILDPARMESSRRRILELAEGNKARVLTQFVGRGNVPPPPGVPLELVEREHALVDALAASESGDLASYGRSLPITTSPPPAVDRLQLRSELHQVWQSIASSDPRGADYVALRSGAAPDWTELADLAEQCGPETPLVSLFSTNSRTFLIIARAGDAYPRVVYVELTIDGWNDIFRRLERDVRIGRSRRGETWSTPLEPLFAAAAEHLAGARRMVLSVPTHSFGIPWTVVAQRAGLIAADGERLPIVTLPSLGVLPRLAARPRREDGAVVVIGNPVDDLPFAEQEANAVADVLGTRAILRGRATRAAVMDQLAEARVVHLATHARFNAESPLDSHIVLADGVLTAREVLGLRMRADLLVLSACETGVSGALGGELAGLAQAFLQAGARSVVVSLWKIDDAATATVMSSFHDRRRGSVPPDVALRDAMEDMRRQARPSGAYIWGPYLFVGDWNY